MTAGNSEIEAALAISAATPLKVAEQIEALPAVAGYRLLPLHPQRLRDRYFDTPDRQLEALRFALRLREVDGTPYLGLKGPARASGWGPVERLEIEAPWSENIFVRIVEELMNRRVRLVEFHGQFEARDPLRAVTRLGLMTVQERATHRKRRSVVGLDGTATEVAELAIDAVTFYFRDRVVRLYEVEVEARAPDCSSALRQVVDGLLALYPGKLRRWHHAKLPTGKAIEKLLNEGVLEGLLDADATLLPAAYVRLEELLKLRA